MKASLAPHEKVWRKAAFAGLMLLGAGAVWAADPDSPSTDSVADLSLEDLVNLKVTSVSKKEEKLSDAAAALPWARRCLHTGTALPGARELT